MKKSKLIAAIGWPMNDSGILVPEFHLSEGNDRRARASASSAAMDELEEMARNKSAVMFEPLPTDTLPNRRGNGSPNPSMRSIIYFSGLASKLLGPKTITSVIESWKGIKATPRPSELSHYKFILFQSKELHSGVLPKIQSRCRELIENALFDRMIERQTPLVKGREDELAALSGIMVNLASDQVAAMIALRYQGLVILLSPRAQNFRTWIKYMLKKWDLDGDADYWMDLSLGIFDQIAMKVRTETNLPSGGNILLALHPRVQP